LHNNWHGAAVQTNHERTKTRKKPAWKEPFFRAFVLSCFRDWSFCAKPPDPDNALLRLDNVVLTPHIGGYSDKFLDASWRCSVEISYLSVLSV
jgi:hypothetical protein